MRDTDRKWLIALGAMTAIILGGGWGLAYHVSRAKVTGNTPDEKIRSICRLADDDAPGAAEALAKAAGDPNPDVRKAALMALWRYPLPQVRPVVEAGAFDNAAANRVAAIAALAHYGDDTAAELLEKLSREDGDPGVRIKAAEALRAIRPDKAIVKPPQGRPGAAPASSHGVTGQADG